MSVTLDCCRDRTNCAGAQTGIGSAACDEVIREHCTKSDNRYKLECGCFWREDRAQDALSNLWHCFDDACKDPAALKLGWQIGAKCPSAVDCIQKVFIYAGGDTVSSVSGLTATQVCGRKEELDNAKALREKQLTDAECSAKEGTCLARATRRARLCAAESAAGTAESEVCKRYRLTPPACVPCGLGDDPTGDPNPGAAGAKRSFKDIMKDLENVSNTDIAVYIVVGIVVLLSLLTKKPPVIAVAILLSVAGLFGYWLGIRE